jgi:hypothetical protein
MSSSMWCLQNRVFPSPNSNWELELAKTIDCELRKKWELTEAQIKQFMLIESRKERAEFLRNSKACVN